MKLTRFVNLSLLMFVLACSNQEEDTSRTRDSGKAGDTIACAPGGSRLNIALIEKLTEMKGVEKNGEYKITVPQNDLNVVVDGFKITPPMGLSTWVAFTP